MINTKKKAHNKIDFDKLIKKHKITKSGSKKEIATRLWKLRQHVMTLAELKLIEDFLKMPPSKRYKGSRYYTRKNGNLYCASKNCLKIT